MTETVVLTVELPTDLARWVAEKVAAGEFASETDIVREGLESLGGSSPSDEWLRSSAVPTYRACLADPTRLRSLDEVFDRLGDQYRRDMRALGREP